MYTYRTSSTTRPDNMELVMETEALGWEFMFIVSEHDQYGNRYYYWFRKPMHVQVDYQGKPTARVRAVC